MKKKTVRLEEMNEYTFKQAKIDKILLPIGSCESHGEHLPYGCDSMLCHQLAIDVAERLENTAAAPPQYFGMSGYYMHKPMCLTLSNDTLKRVIMDLLESVAHWGIRKVLIVNGHDGNIPAIEMAGHDFKAKYPDFKLAVLDAWWITAGNLLPKDTFEVWNGLGHGGEGETSLGLATFPDLCDMSRAKGDIAEFDPNVKLIWNFEELTRYGASGDPSKATKEKGMKMRKALADCLVDFVKRMDKQNWHYNTTADGTFKASAVTAKPAAKAAPAAKKAAAKTPAKKPAAGKKAPAKKAPVKKAVAKKK